MPSFIATIIQSALLKTAANLIVQLVSQWRAHQPRREIDWQRVAEFAVFGLIQAQLNWWWQQFLEDCLPTNTAPIVDQKEKPRDAAYRRAPLANGNVAPTPLPQQRSINKVNVALKLVLDMTLGLCIMNTTFVVCTNAARLRSVMLVWQAVRQRTFGVIVAAWKIWPIVSICNFIWVPVESRVMVSSLVGFGWNMFLAFKTMVE